MPVLPGLACSALPPLPKSNLAGCPPPSAVRAKRSKSGAISFDLHEAEAGHALD
jgi:hypothetical protein